ncbi:MAG: response regulator transcription factor [Pedobacter sp.]|nr:MAG: response regulator transcription factor [Pedobacter sp.]
MIKCLAVDDEAHATRIISDYINKTPFLELVGTFNNAIDALALVQQGGIDLVFLDIQMPDITGIQFLKLCGSKCKVVLTTAYPQYALEGYEHDVVDYLLKPVAFDRFLKSANKAYSLFKLSNASLNPAADIASMQLNSALEPVVTSPDFMFVKGDNKNRFLKVNYDEILYIEGLKNYVSLFTSDQRIVTYQTLRDLEAQLPKPPFYRIHRSYIISLRKIVSLDGNRVYIGEQAIPIGETYREAFLKKIHESF